MKRLMGFFLLLSLVMATAATPASAGTVSGFVFDSESGAPLPSQSFPYVYLRLQRFNESGWWEYINSTNCPGQGCVDETGHFTFTASYDGGSIPSGKCLLESWSYYDYMLERKYFTCTSNAFIGAVLMDRQPVRIELLETPKPVPSTGGVAQWRYQLTNLTDNPVRTEIHVLVSGAAETDFWTQVQVQQRNVTVSNKSRQFTEKITIPGNIPDGSVCLNIKATAPGKPFRTLDDIWSCIQKGNSGGGKG